jgi:hypothetical protein
LNGRRTISTTLIPRRLYLQHHKSIDLMRREGRQRKRWQKRQ